MRICVTAPLIARRVTGPGRVVLAVVRELAAAGHDVLLITFPGPLFAKVKVELPPGVGFEAVSSSGAFETGSPPALGKILVRFRPDALFCHEMRNGLTNAAARWSRRHGVALTIMPHGELFAFRRMPGAWRRAPYVLHDLLRGRLVDRKANVIVTSEIEKQDVLQVTPKDRVFLCYLGSDLRMPGRERRERGLTRVMMLANHGVFRDPRWALSGIHQIVSGTRPFELVIAGPMENQSRFASRIPPSIRASTEYLGALDDQGLVEAYGECDLFLYPSRYESFGLPLLEAALAGCPLVTTHVGIAPELDVDRRTGILVDSVNGKDIGRGLELALASLAEFKHVAADRANRLREWAAWKRRAAPFVQVIEDGRLEREPEPPARAFA